MIKKTKGFFAKILSRHGTHNVFRLSIGKFSVKSVIRLGSTTVLPDDNTRIQINTPQAVMNSSSKLLMKQCFRQANVKTANWYIYDRGAFFLYDYDEGSYEKSVNELKYPIIAKSHYGSRGLGNTKLDTLEQLKSWLIGKNTDNYIFEEYFNGSREYRFHVSIEGVFLTWRKLRRNDTPNEQRWFFNNQTCNWVSEQHELYNKPKTYDEICNECLKALNSVGLDIGACDVRVNKEGEFIIVEINSAPSMAEQTTIAYKAELTKLITNKIK
jgi:D-alanine-D-alanine ligase-like ATP-grasp enzyme